jgi:hypothetical protein
MRNMKPQLFNRTMPGGGRDPGPTFIDDVINRVRQPAALRLALLAWHEIQQRYQTVSDELRQAAHELQNAGGETSSNSGPQIKRVAELDCQLRALSNQAKGALEAVVAARPPWVRAVVAALQPHSRAAAQRALAAAATPEAALDTLEEADQTTSAVGGSPGRHPLPGYRATIGSMIERLRQIAGGAPRRIRPMP